ncbi:MAG: phosphatase PAP2 family protein [Oscillospiraceae bacterium]|nr:phosphatase PAP2 family protein [Oscillospiraceae bacterium]
MLRRTLQRIVPTYALLPLAFTGLMNLVSYTGAKWIQSIFALDNALDMTAKWDMMIPFEPVWILPYLITFAFWFYLYTTIAKEGPEAAYRLVTADFLGKIVSMIIFIAMPTTNVRPEVAGTGFIPFVIRFVYWIDAPRNLFPSLHCYIAWLGTRQIFEARKLRHRGLNGVLCVIASLIVFASTLFTKQHVIADVISGVALAEICFVIAKYTKLPNVLKACNERFMRTKLCKFYDTENWRTV